MPCVSSFLNGSGFGTRPCVCHAWCVYELPQDNIPTLRKLATPVGGVCTHLIVQEAGDKARVQQVHDSMLHATNVKVDRLPLVNDLLIEDLVGIVGVRVAQKVPAWCVWLSV